jgi:putative oxidoreductase
MNKTPSTTKNIGLFILRVVPSAAMLVHGMPKLMKLINGQMTFADPIGLGEPTSLILAVIGEVVAPILLIIGLKTRLSAVPAAITMAVALFIVHGDDAFKKQELALLYLTFFVAIIFLGGGAYSLDGLLKGKK